MLKASLESWRLQRMACSTFHVRNVQHHLSELGGLQQAECEDFSMWSFLRAAGLVCGCWGR